MERSPFSVDSADGNEACCGACRAGGDLICCEGCPAAFHPECAGYSSADEVPEGDWYCWFCSKDRRKRYQHPKTQFQPPHGNAYVMLATDETANVFIRTKVTSTSEGYVELVGVDVKREEVIVHKTSHRLWHGTTNRAAWTLEKDGINWRPNARLFKVDQEALKALLQTKAAANHVPSDKGEEVDSDSSRSRRRRREGAAPAPAGAEAGASSPAGGTPKGSAGGSKGKLRLSLRADGGAPQQHKEQKEPGSSKQSTPQHKEHGARRHPPRDGAGDRQATPPHKEPAQGKQQPGKQQGDVDGQQQQQQQQAAHGSKRARLGFAASLKQGLSGLLGGATRGAPASPGEADASPEADIGAAAAAGRGAGAAPPALVPANTASEGGGQGASTSPPAGASVTSPGLAAAHDAAVAAALARGVARVPAGEIGAGLPVIPGGAGKAAFDAALASYWRGALKPGARPPHPILINNIPVDPWALWREVWSWGGPAACSKHKLWATVGYSFSPPTTATSVSTRMMRFYDAMLAGLDAAIDAGKVKLQRPPHCRELQDRALQLRPHMVAGAGTSPSGGPSSSGGGGSSKRGSKPAAGVPAAVAAASSGGGGAGAAGGGAQAGGSSARQQDKKQRKQQRKRARAGSWGGSSSADEGDGGAALQPSSDEDSLLGDADGGGGTEGPAAAGDGRAHQQQRQQVQQQQHRLDGGSGAGAKRMRTGPGPGAGAARPPAQVGRPLGPMALSGGGAPGGFAYLLSSCDQLLLGRVRLTPTGWGLKVGDAVDFRQPVSSGEWVTGWRSGTVLATAPGSDWEGGRRLLIQPRHAPHHHARQQQQRGGGGSSRQGSGGSSAAAAAAPDSPPGPAAAAALAALAAAGGAPTDAAAAAAAAQRLLTPTGQLRHEVAALLPARSGSLKPGGGGGGGDSAAAGAGAEPADALAPVWVPVVWRGRFTAPFVAPPLLVRPHYVPAASATLPGDEGRGAAGAGASPFAAEQQQQQGPGGAGAGHAAQQQQQCAVRVGDALEVLRDGAWWPCEVVSLRAAAGGGGGGSSGGDAVTELGAGVGGGGGTCVVLRNMAVPEADGGVWRCTAAHPMRPLHPQYASGCGMLLADILDEPNTTAQLRKQLQPYTYAGGGIQAFACLEHLRAA